MQDPFRDCPRLPFDIWAKILGYLIPHEELKWDDDAKKRYRQIDTEMAKSSLPLDQWVKQTQREQDMWYEKWRYRRSFFHYNGEYSFGVDENIIKRFILFSMYLYREYGGIVLDDRYDWMWDQACSMITTNTNTFIQIPPQRDFIIKKATLKDILENNCKLYCRACTNHIDKWQRRLYEELELEQKEPRPLCKRCTFASIPKVNVKHLYKYGLLVRDLERVPRFGDMDRFFYLPHILKRSKKTGKRKRSDNAETY